MAEKKRWQQRSANNVHFIYWTKQSLKDLTFDHEIWHKEFSTSPVGSRKRELARLALRVHKKCVGTNWIH